MIRMIAWDICRLPLSIGQVVLSHMTCQTVERHEVEAILHLHRQWFWGEVNVDQHKHNDRSALLGGTVQSNFSLADGRRIFVTTLRCRCGRWKHPGKTTFVFLASEIHQDGRCRCSRKGLPPHLWPENNQAVPTWVTAAWETILFHLSATK